MKLSNIDKVVMIIVFFVLLIVCFMVGERILSQLDDYVYFCDKEYGKGNWHSEYNYSTSSGQPVYSCIGGRK